MFRGNNSKFLQYDKIAALKNSELFRDIPTKCFFRKTAGLQLRPLLVNVLQNFNL